MIEGGLTISFFLLHLLDFVMKFFTFNSDAKSYWWSSFTKILCIINIWVQFFLVQSIKKNLYLDDWRSTEQKIQQKEEVIHSASNSLPNHATVSVSSVL